MNELRRWWRAARAAGAAVGMAAGLCALPAVAQQAVPGEAPAAAPAPSATPVAAGAVATTWSLPLSRFTGDTAPLRVQGVQGELRLSLPMPALLSASEVVLELVGTASQALINSSQVAVELNGRVVAQQRLAGQSALRLSVALPVSLLHEGYNEVRLAFAQHYHERCEYPMAPELWTQIDPVASRFVVRAAPRAVPLRLDRLDELFDKRSWDEAPLVPVFTAAAPDAGVLSALSLVAQGIGQRYDYLPVRVGSARLPARLEAVAEALPPGARGGVAVGTLAQMAPMLAGVPLPSGGAPVAVLRRLPGDEGRFLLVLAAQDAAGLEQIARAFAMPRMPWPDKPWATVSQLRMPPLGSVTGAAASLRPATQAFPLSAQGFRTVTLVGMGGSGGASVRFWNPAWQGRVQVRVHAAYAAGMAPQSALNVVANGTMHGSIPLDNPAGGVYDNYAVTVPAGALRPGWNTLTLQPNLVPRNNGGECQAFFPGNLAVTVYEDTTLQTFGGSPLQRPDLGLLAYSGRPMPDVPVGVGMAVQLTDAQDATVGAGLTLLSKLAQVFRGPLLRTQLTVGAAQGVTNHVWVGPVGGLPDAVRRAAGLDAQGGLDVPVPLIQTSDVPVREGQVLLALRDQVDAFGAAPGTLSAQAAVAPALQGRSAAVTTLDKGEPVTVFTALDAAALEAGMRQLVGHGAWSQLKGSVALWRAGEEPLQTVTPDDAPFTAYSLRGGLGLWISQYPWWALSFLLVLLGSVVWLLRTSLARYRRRHLPAQPARRHDDKA
ncbi:cellulose biosynthesis cyclic di-GMP-binding regulatory protein BcsB [Azohydromonas lata]|uniref:Cyclic di-GMP-binding protein n=1 Tax=Azohydromonas lata TaxID=45677 RepID=A0ABU5IKG4_9BURK|nr:cellulose biosynthesis cyclic di-GMP-binding regulatory protein BcsB [Azohydromonas lata]MDZ5459359.1 cellulose biosynthesis cyclic di-GMP-binding regulatory protein BcsB [Azohydromonas lata]